MPNHEKPVAQVAIDELQADVTSPEDQAVLDAWQTELNQSRAQTVGKLASEGSLRQVAADGTVLTQNEVNDIRENGPAEGPYKGGHR